MNINTSLLRPLVGLLLTPLAASTLRAQPKVDSATIQIATRSNGASAGYASAGTYLTPYGTVSVSTRPFTLLTSRSTGGGLNFDTGSYAYLDYFFRFSGAPGALVPATFMAGMFARIAINAADEETAAFSSFRLFSADGTGRFYTAAEVSWAADRVSRCG